ncbi:MAG: elongation factor P [Candidatus Sumerlaeia bacterium]|nr:elongation factor P [Candidatus Sumerlaeia bacterium]
MAVTMKDVRNGMYVGYEGDVWVVTEFHHRTPGNLRAFVQCKIKSLTTGRVIDKTLRGGETFEDADVEYRHMTYLYGDDTGRHFMDQQTYDQAALPDDLLGDHVKYLLENMEVDVTYFNGRPIGVKLPVKVELKVVETVPGVKGDTVSNVTKEAKVETGLVVQVPLFVNEGDVIQVDTRDGSYVTRVSSR